MATTSTSGNSNFLSGIYAKVIQGRQKAVAAFVVAAVSSFIARYGLTLDASALSYLQAVVIGAIAHLSVFATRNA